MSRTFLVFPKGRKQKARFGGTAGNLEKCYSQEIVDAVEELEGDHAKALLRVSTVLYEGPTGT